LDVCYPGYQAYQDADQGSSVLVLLPDGPKNGMETFEGEDVTMSIMIVNDVVYWE
jgi:hypothetical protein